VKTNGNGPSKSRIHHVDIENMGIAEVQALADGEIDEMVIYKLDMTDESRYSLWSQESVRRW